MPTSIVEVVAPSNAFKPADAAAESLLAEIHAIMEKEYAVHPFSSRSVTRENGLSVMRQYFAMSQAFPYLQVCSLLLWEMER
jgi:hypothetical protein